MITKTLFLASSAELKEDRMEFEIFINRKNKDWVARDVFIELVVWEDFLDAVSSTRLQDEYNRAIRDCDLFVMLFWTKVGQYTEEEFETAFGQFQATQRPFIFTYFKDAEISTAAANKKDLMSLWAFQERLSTLGHFYTVYKTIDELKYKFNRQLDKLAANGFIELDRSAEDEAEATANANLTGSGAIAQSSGALAAGRGGVVVGGDHAGNINTGTLIRGDLVGADKVLGSKIGTQINTGGGAYFGGPVAAREVVGRDRFTGQGSPESDLELLFGPLMAAVGLQAPADKLSQAAQEVRALKTEVAKGEQADDNMIGRIVDSLVVMVPGALPAVASLMETPRLRGVAGPVTKFVLDRSRGR